MKRYRKCSLLAVKRRRCSGPSSYASSAPSPQRHSVNLKSATYKFKQHLQRR
ncbi:hypothetical protein DPMN_001887 [Dreissena polymorpha]|uniref:Uncharacterized protein n=1 Tax=Dreissena polymorpha TaxID=45954 RepID=A0A9D4MMK0_DREPO|nr:hypothetical protein DPMN_001887 [Dreissena polymorpha]